MPQPPVPAMPPPAPALRAKRPSQEPPMTLPATRRPAPPLPAPSLSTPAAPVIAATASVKKRVPPPFSEEPTKKLEPGSPLVQMLRAAQGAGVPAAPKKGGFDDEATRSAATRSAPVRAAAPPRSVASRFDDDESTRAVDMDPLAIESAAHDTHDELIDVGYMTGHQAQGAIDLGHRDTSRPFALDESTAVADTDHLIAMERARTAAAGRKPPGKTPGKSQARPHAGGSFDEPTRAADGVRPKTLSDVEWDID
jgi:hypothetical protein